MQDAVRLVKECRQLCFGMLSQNLHSNMEHNSRERDLSLVYGQLWGFQWLQAPGRLGEGKEERVSGRRVSITVKGMLLPFLPILLPAVFSLCFLLCCWDISHHTACGFNVLFAVAPLFPSNLFITCGRLGDQIMQLLRTMCVNRLPVSPELPHKSPTWPLLHALAIFTLAAAYDLLVPAIS